MFQQFNIITHVIAGSLALLIGLIPIFSKKGSTIHRRYGQVFLAFMFITILTAAIGALFFRSRPFLTVITLQSGYLSFAGYRILQTKTKGPTIMDLLASIFLLFIASRFLLRVGGDEVVWDQSVVLYLLGFLFMVGSYDVLRFFWRSLARYWLLEHIFKMTAAYIALFSAFAGTVLAAWQPYSQILPSVIGTVWIVGTMWYYGGKRKAVDSGI